MNVNQREQERERAEVLIGLFFRLFHQVWLKAASMRFLKGAAGRGTCVSAPLLSGSQLISALPEDLLQTGGPHG